MKLSDVVKDTPLPTFAIDLSFITKLFAARRKLLHKLEPDARARANDHPR